MSDEDKPRRSYFDELMSIKPRPNILRDYASALLVDEDQLRPNALREALGIGRDTATDSATANVAIATIDKLLEQGFQRTDAEWLTKTLKVAGNLDAQTRLGVAKLIDEHGRVPTGFTFDPATPLPTLKTALLVVATGDEKTDATARERRETIRFWCTTVVAGVAAVAAIIAAWGS